VYDFVKKLYEGRKVEAIVDVWCDAPVHKLWKEFANSALTEEGRENVWSKMEYWFTMGEFFLDICAPQVLITFLLTGVHPHEAKLYTDEVEKDMYAPLLESPFVPHLHLHHQSRSYGPPALCRLG